jgi:hypothetical protein
VTNGRMPLYLTLLAGLVFALALAVLQPYSVTSHWRAYTKPAQRFLQAAVKQDSLALVRQSNSDSAVAWALHAARLQPESLEVWARTAQASTGGRRGDTIDVLLESTTEVCSAHPIWISFVGTGDDARVLDASSACFETR